MYEGGKKGKRAGTYIRTLIQEIEFVLLDSDYYAHTKEGGSNSYI